MNFSQVLDHNYDNVLFETTEKMSDDDSSRGRTPVWIEKDTLEVVSYPERNLLTVVTPSDYSTSIGEILRYKKINKRWATNSRIQENKMSSKPSKRPHNDETNHENRCKRKRSKTNIKNISSSFIKNYKKRNATSYFGNYGLKMKKKIKECKNLQYTSSKPVRMINNVRRFCLLNLIKNHFQIPGSLIELCHADLSIPANSNYQQTTKDKKKKRHIGAVNDLSSDIAATEESVLIDIVMDDMEETIALRRSIGTDAVTMDDEKEAVMEKGHDTNLDSGLQVKSENVHFQTIFLNGIYFLLKYCKGCIFNKKLRKDTFTLKFYFRY